MRIKTLILSITALLCTTQINAQGWPAKYDGVMLQGFYWDSYLDTQWSNLESQADEISKYFSLIWVPQSGNTNSAQNNMGYMPVYYFNQKSSFGGETELRSMIKTYKSKGTGIIADVVINHRNTLTDWTDFPAETYKGVTYQMLPTDIVSNDDGGKTLAAAKSEGITISSNSDTGDGFDNCRDLDHKSSNVNKVVKAYLDYLLNDLGYSGFRYDMVKGYSASFTGDYNSTVKPTFSVGENWSGTTTIKNWINGTKVNDVPTSGAFDFQFRYRVQNAANNGDWRKLSASDQGTDGQPLIYDSNYQQYAVTFVENHDTQYRSADAQQDPLKKDTLAANAFMLSMPGTPCVFLTHWKAYRKEIKLMIEARKLAGINNQSTYTNRHSVQASYSNEITGTNGKLIVTVGTNTSLNAPSESEYKLLLSGYHYRIYISKGAYGDWDNIVKRVEAEEANHQDFEPYTATIYVRNENTWDKTNFYIWDSKGTNINGNWPGKQITDTKVVDGYTWYYQTFDITASDYCVNVVFSTGTGSPQTIDVSSITEDKYLVIKTATTSGRYNVEDVTSTISAYQDEDINQDGNVDSQDVLKVYDWMKTSTSSATSTTREDVNKDNSVDSQDVLKIYDYMKGH